MTPSLLRYALHTREGNPGHEAFWKAVEGMLTPEQRQRLSEGGDVRTSTWLSRLGNSTEKAVLERWEQDIRICRPLLDLIYKYEAGGFPSPYEAFNRGGAGDSLGQQWPGGLQRLTIGEIKALQRVERLFAVGAPQLIPSTLREQQPRSGLTDADRFSAFNQDRLTVTILLRGKRPMLSRYILQGTNLNAAIDDLAYEWASLPNSAGRGWYDGDAGGNKAHGSLQEVTAALQATRARAINPPAA